MKKGGLIRQKHCERAKLFYRLQAALGILTLIVAALCIMFFDAGAAIIFNSMRLQYDIYNQASDFGMGLTNEGKVHLDLSMKKGD